MKPYAIQLVYNYYRGAAIGFDLVALIQGWEHAPEDTYVEIVFQDGREAMSFRGDAHLAKKLSRDQAIARGKGIGETWLKPGKLEDAKYDRDCPMDSDVEAFRRAAAGQMTEKDIQDIQNSVDLKWADLEDIAAWAAANLDAPQ